MNKTFSVLLLKKNSNRVILRMNVALFLRKIDWILVASALLLSGMGLVGIYSITHGSDTFILFNKQAFFLIISLLLVGVVSYLDFRVLNHSQIIFFLYAVTIGMLLLVLFVGSDIRGVSRWFRIGPVSFEPVEIAKITLILLLAKYFSMRHIEIARIKHVFVSGAYVAIPSFLLLLQPDLGSILILIVVWLGIMLIAGIKTSHLALLLLVGVLVVALGWAFVFKDYQKERIITFLNPERDPLGSSYNLTQSIIAVGSGGVLGKGIGMGTQVQSGFLPESTTDFIYAAITEEMGLAGGAFILFLFGVIFLRLFYISLDAGNNFGRFILAGISAMFIAQIFITIGMTMGMFPVAGIPLPFVSYGGSALLTSFLALGIIQSIKVHSS